MLPYSSACSYSDYKSPYQQHQQKSIFHSPPTTPPGQNQFCIHSPPSSPTHSSDFAPSSPTTSYYSQQEERQQMDQTSPPPHTTSTTTTLKERRQRNKAASAKYRQKKNMQQHEMHIMIHQITEQNSLLTRQMQEVREENQKLKATADKLRGKFVAKKMLRQWISRYGQQQQRLPPIIPSPSSLHLQSISSSLTTTTTTTGNEVDLHEVEDDDDSGSLCSDI